MPKPKAESIQNKDTLHRMNFLYQAANMVKNDELSKFYSQQLLSVSHKLVIRLNPSIKRTICKKCKSILVPGRNCVVKVEDIIIWNCSCGEKKRFPYSPYKPLFTDKIK